MTISLLPVFMLGIGIFILSADRIANGIYNESYAGMQAAALAVRDIFEVGNQGEYHLDDNGDLWKGKTLNISQSDKIVEHIKETTGMDVSIFWGDTRILTSIKNETGEQQTQTKAPDAVVKKVLEKARNGEDVLLAYIGGSITEGANATDETCYVTKSYDGFVELTGAKEAGNVSFVNAGLGGTSSALGIMRYDRDIVEYTGKQPGIRGYEQEERLLIRCDPGKLYDRGRDLPRQPLEEHQERDRDQGIPKRRGKRWRRLDKILYLAGETNGGRSPNYRDQRRREADSLTCGTTAIHHG